MTFASVHLLPLLLCLIGGAAIADAAMTPETASLVAPVHGAFEEVERRQAALPPARTDRERLERLFDLDQAGRDAMQSIDLSQLPELQQDLAIADVAALMTAHDMDNQAALKAMLPKSGWFRKSEIGDKAEQAALLIVQHAVNDPGLMDAMLTRIEAAVGRGEADGGDYALLYDRIALEFDHRPQRYGTQVECSQGRWAPIEVENPQRLDALRASIGLPSEAEYLQGLETAPCQPPAAP